MRKLAISKEESEPAKVARGRMEGVVLAAYLRVSESKGSRPRLEVVQPA